jgi:hypothetical protein
VIVGVPVLDKHAWLKMHYEEKNMVKIMAQLKMAKVKTASAEHRAKLANGLKTMDHIHDEVLWR